MNLENLKNTWKEEEVSTPEISMEKQTEIRNPLEKVKKNIKFEVWSTLPIFPIVLILLFNMIKDKKLLLFSTVFVIIAMLVCLFFYFKIYQFYKEISTNTLTSYQHTLELEYQMKYFRDLYQAYYIAFVPVLLSEFFLIFLIGGVNEFENFESLAGTLIINLFICFLLLFFFWYLWYQFFYGRHFNKIKSIIKNIK